MRIAESGRKEVKTDVDFPYLSHLLSWGILKGSRIANRRDRRKLATILSRWTLGRFQPFVECWYIERIATGVARLAMVTTNGEFRAATSSSGCRRQLRNASAGDGVNTW